jgi:cardiolipin synthase
LDVAHLNLGLTFFQYLVAATTAWSGLSYAYLKNAVTIIGSNEELKARQGARGRAIIGVTFGSLVLLAAWQHIKGDEDATKEVA